MDPRFYMVVFFNFAIDPTKQKAQKGDRFRESRPSFHDLQVEFSWNVS